ncbi:hypothetical protein [Alicyclobacillus ferrooxydans]|uniref:CopG family transcriptional regulator n=1 Tax=Alicyclobacillus ferrooxydans TaxID=471514 RepID=A0A0P9GPR4_9BACL|nr:hypothetical protein [Alicyclobacillus ferrooxydans]KPV42682.1 hypothetical protein AN477_16245 [Alicyclobacillus ferrooxydans]
MKKTLYLSDAALTSLTQYQTLLKKRGIKSSESEIVSHAVVQYVLAEGQDYARKQLDQMVEELMRKQFNRLAAMIGSVGMDVAMVLMDTLDERHKEYPEVKQRQIYTDLRDNARKYFSSKESFKIQEFVGSSSSETGEK